MKRRSEVRQSWEEDVNKIVGLGNKSIRKSYYPELKKKISSLDEKNVFYQSVLNAIPDGIVITDSADLIIQINPAMTRLSGYGEEELKGLHISELYAKGEIGGAGGEVWTDLARRYLRKDGTQFIGERLSSVIVDNNKNYAGNIEVVRDISERVETHLQKKELEKQIQKSQKMEAIGSLAGGIAHDFNNILSGIIGYAELIELFEMSDLDDIRHNIHQILQASYRARELVNQIMTFSRGGGQEPVWISPINVAQESLEIVRASLPDHIELQTEFAKLDDTVYGDPTQLHQVITNLCTNAIYAMKEKGGILRLKISEAVDSDCTTLPTDLSSEQKMLLLEVADSGCGIPQKVIDHIFEPYFTTKQPGEGTGFGLALVHGIVKSHNGFIEVSSEEGQGSLFKIFLPLKKALQQQQEPTTKSIVGEQAGSVLLVDDELSQRDWGGRFLEKLGYTVKTAPSGHEALELFEAAPMAFDFVITDQTMPSMTGLELAEKIRLRRADIPIILCTGFSHGLSMENIQSAGITRLVTKPYSLNELAGILQQLAP